MLGYNSLLYAKSFEGVGKLISSKHGDISLLERDIPGTNEKDLISLYPLNTSPEGFYTSSEGFYDDLRDKDHVSATLILSPLFDLPYGVSDLKERDWDIIKDYKEHYIVDLSKPIWMASDHWDKVRTFAKTGYEVSMRVLYPHNVVDYARRFHKLYQTLVKKRGIEGVTNFSEQSIIRQFQVPGLLVFEVLDERGDPMAIRTFYLDGQDNCYFHLGAASHKAFAKAPGHSQAIHYEAITYLKQLGLSKLVLGSIPDVGGEGLRSFKQGFSNMETKTNLIVMKVLNQDIYDKLVSSRNTEYVPPYRG